MRCKLKIVLRGILSVSFLLIIVCIVLLLNFTAPNPTGRRYSSQMPITTGQGNAQQIGLSAELILANDLNLPRNEDQSQRQCACSLNFTPNTSDCHVCFAYSEFITTYRRPDFVGSNFIAESKNRQNLLYTYRDQVDQISDYAAVARMLRQPLYVYTRVNTQLDPEFVQLVELNRGRHHSLFHCSGIC